VQVFVSPVYPENNADYTFKFDGDINHWYLGELTISKAVGPVKVTITDYHYCKNTEIILNPIVEHENMYRLMTDINAIREDGEKNKWEYAVVAEVDGIHYALGLDGTAKQVHVVDHYITDKDGTPLGTIGESGLYFVYTSEQPYVE
jgi:hypothetical protein